MLNSEKTYEIGDWVKSKHSYYKLCPNCNNNFFGSYRKIYCDIKCKEKYNNDKSKVRRDKEKEIVLPIVKNFKILELFHALNGEGQQVPINNLKENGFDSSIFLKSLKDTAGKEWFAIHIYAYRMINSTHLLIRKIK